MLPLLTYELAKAIVGSMAVGFARRVDSLWSNKSMVLTAITSTEEPPTQLGRQHIDKPFGSHGERSLRKIQRRANCGQPQTASWLRAMLNAYESTRRVSSDEVLGVDGLMNEGTTDTRSKLKPMRAFGAKGIK